MDNIAIIGIGRLGLCLALNLEKVGYKVLGIDVSQGYVDSINIKSFQSPEPQVNEYLIASENFKATTSVSGIFEQGIELIFIVVPTPSLPGGEFDHSHIDKAVDSLLQHGKQKTSRHLIINSTTIPGYCDELAERIKEYNYTVSYNPEFIAQGSIIADQQKPDQVLIGEADAMTGDKIQEVYKRLCSNKPVYCRMSRLSAEITKLATNCFLTTKISFANSIGDLAAKAGAEPEKILKAIGADSRIGTKYFNYGFGYGGPCFPRDNRAFTSFATRQQLAALICEATDKTNQQHAGFLLEQWLAKHPLDAVIEFDSVTYKKGTDILEESQQLQLAIGLARAGRKVKIKESAAVIKTLIDVYANLFTYEVNG